MRKHIAYLLCACILSLNLLACGLAGPAGENPNGSQVVRGSGKLVQETRPVSGFHGVSLETLGEMEIQYGDQESLRIEAEDNLIQYFQVRVENGVLKIGGEDKLSLDPTLPVKFFVTVKALDRIEASSLGSIWAHALEAENFAIRLSSAGNVVVEALKAGRVDLVVGSLGTLQVGRLEAGQLDVQLSSSGNLEIDTGLVGELKVLLTNLGSLKASNLDTVQGAQGGSLEVKVESSGSVELGALSADTAEFRLASIGGVSIRTLNTGRLQAWVEGSGDLAIGAGQVGEQIVTLSSLGSYQAGALACDRAEVKISGSGSAEIQATQLIQGELSSIGHLRYKGSPVVEVSATGTGQVEQVTP
jgi:hypothetical protein